MSPPSVRRGMVDVITASWLGAVVGVALATLWPYYNAWKANKVKFDRTYALSALIAAVLALPSSTAVWAIVTALVTAQAPSLAEYLTSAAFAFAVGVFVGAGGSRWINENIVDKARAVASTP